jgi:hypothetical protein
VDVEPVDLCEERVDAMAVLNNIAESEDIDVEEELLVHIAPS